MQARQATIDVDYLGVKITKDVQADLLSFAYTDNASGEADSINITLKDDTGKWMTSWAPQKGDKIKASILTTNWRHEGDKLNLNTGLFTVDDVGHSGRPRIISIGAISLPANEGFRETPRSKTWKKVNLKQIAQGIATKYKFKFSYDSKDLPYIEFVEQSETSDLSFLMEICTKYGFALKLFSNQIVVFKEAEYEARKSIATINETDMLSWDCKDTLTNRYDGCTVEYKGKKGKLIKYTYKIPKSKGNKLLKVNEPVYNLAEAQRVAKAKLREANKEATTLSLAIPGNSRIVAACCVDIKGLGNFSGKYYIDQATHNLPNYTVGLELHKVLGGY